MLWFLAWGGALFAPAAAMVSSQRSRGLPVTGASTVVAVVLGLVTAFAASLWSGGLGVDVLATGTLAYVLAVVVRTDIISWRIPTDTCWHGSVIGVALLLFALIGGAANISVAAVVVAGAPVIAAIISWLFSSGGFGDVRACVTGFLLTAWWVSENGILVGFLAGIAVSLTLTLTMARVNASGKKIIPAGPTYLTGYLIAAVFSLAASGGA